MSIEMAFCVFLIRLANARLLTLPQVSNVRGAAF
jgi:hypothetical protein